MFRTGYSTILIDFDAGVAELADAQDLKSCDLIGRAGSIPALGTSLLPVLGGELARSCNPDMTPHLI